MSEEVTTETTETQTDEAQIEAAKELLISQGLNVLDSKTFGQRLEKERSKYKTDLEKLQADYEKTKDRASELAKFKREIEDKDRSEIEIWERRQKEWEAQDTAQKQAIEAARSDVEAQKERMKEYQVERHLSRLMPDARNAELALMWAKAKVPGLGVSEDGVLTFTEPTGVSHEGPAAEKFVSDWWARQEDMRSAKSPGPPTKGSPAPPPVRSDEFVMKDSGDLAANLAAAERWNREHGIRE